MATAAPGFLVNMADEEGEARGELEFELQIQAVGPPLPPLPGFSNQSGSAPASPSFVLVFLPAPHGRPRCFLCSAPLPASRAPEGVSVRRERRPRPQSLRSPAPSQGFLRQAPVPGTAEPGDVKARLSLARAVRRVRAAATSSRREETRLQVTNTSQAARALLGSQ